MTARQKKMMYWLPRWLCIAFAAFLGVFALDVFHAHQEFWDVTLALFMHLIPTMIILGILAMAWRREWLGAVLFPLLGFLYLYLGWGNWMAMAIISGSLFLLGILFLISYKAKKA